MKVAPLLPVCQWISEQGICLSAKEVLIQLCWVEDCPTSSARLHPLPSSCNHHACEISELGRPCNPLQPPCLETAWAPTPGACSLSLLIQAALFPKLHQDLLSFWCFFPSPVYFHDRIIFYQEICVATHGKGTHFFTGPCWWNCSQPGLEHGHLFISLAQVL